MTCRSWFQCAAFAGAQALQDTSPKRVTLSQKRLHEQAQNCRCSAYFCSMAHNHDHLEPEQNEIGGPVVFALFLFAIVVVAIGMMAS